MVRPDCVVDRDLLEEVRVMPPDELRLSPRPFMLSVGLEPERLIPMLGRTAVATAAVWDTSRPLSLRLNPSPAMVSSSFVLLPSLPYLF